MFSFLLQTEQLHDSRTCWTSMWISTVQFHCPEMTSSLLLMTQLRCELQSQILFLSAAKLCSQPGWLRTKTFPCPLLAFQPSTCSTNYLFRANGAIWWPLNQLPLDFLSLYMSRIDGLPPSWLATLPCGACWCFETEWPAGRNALSPWCPLP